MSTLPTTGKKVPLRSTDFSLDEAFATFTEAADSLETFYSSLKAEVGHLRRRLDETNQELAESLEANRRMRLHLERVLDSLPCGVVVLDALGVRRLVNPEAQRLLTTRDPDSGSLVLADLTSQLSASDGDGTQSEQELRVEGPARVRHVGVRSRSLPGSASTGDETVYILRDLTEEHQLQEEMDAARRVQALADMAGLLAHEIRNPLGSLELFAGLIGQNSPDDSELRVWADHLQAGLRSLAATANNVLQFHSASADMHVSVNLVDLLSETISFLDPMARQWNTEVRLSSQCDAPTVSADAQGLRQVFLNLAINAFSAMPSGGVLDITVSPDVKDAEEWIRIAFADRGRGIAPEDLGDIFNPGFSTKPNSSGLGLSVCRRIVEKSNGTITVTSVPDESTTFVLSFRSIGEAE